MLKTRLEVLKKVEEEIFDRCERLRIEIEFTSSLIVSGVETDPLSNASLSVTNDQKRIILESQLKLLKFVQEEIKRIKDKSSIAN